MSYGQKLENIKFPSTVFVESLQDTFVLYKPYQEEQLAKEFKLLELEKEHFKNKYTIADSTLKLITSKVEDIENSNDLLRIRGLELKDNLEQQKINIEQLNKDRSKLKRTNRWLRWTTFALSVVSLTLLLK